MSMLARAYLHLRMGERERERENERKLSFSFSLSRTLIRPLIRSCTQAHTRVLYARDYKSRANEWLPFVITAVGTLVRWAPT